MSKLEEKKEKEGFEAEEANASSEEVNETEESTEAPETAEAEAEKEAKAETEEAEKSEESEKEGFFKKKKDKKVTELEEKVKELTDQRIRQMAEFENFRKRTDKEKSQMFDLGAKSVIEKILPVVDNFERGLASLPEAEKDSPFADGMNKIYKQLMTELDNLGVKAIEAKGQEFNPDLHNAVMQVESEELESGTVAEELQKGYTYHDIVVRHSMVSVVQ